MKYKVSFEIEGTIEVVADSEDEAEIIAMDMGRGELLEEGDETAFRASAYEMDKEDW